MLGCSCVCAGVNQETFVREMCTPRRILPRLVTVCSTVFETCWVLVLAQLFDWMHREVGVKACVCACVRLAVDGVEVKGLKEE